MTATIDEMLRGSGDPPLPPAFTQTQLRRWLAGINAPDRLDDPALVELLERHGRLPQPASRLAVGRAASSLLLEAIERLRPPESAPRRTALPYLALLHSLSGAKGSTVADLLGISVRQLSRERARGIELLHAELDSEPALQTRHVSSSYNAEPIPAIHNFQPRPHLWREFSEALEEHHNVNLYGAPGVGKSSFVAEVASDRSHQRSVLWFRLRGGVNDSLRAFLFELGEFLRAEGRPALATAVDSDKQESVCARIALRDLADLPLLLVLDDLHAADRDPSIARFLAEAVTRLPGARVVTVSRQTPPRDLPGPRMEMPPFSLDETRRLLARLGVAVEADVATTVHEWTRGVPQLLTFAVRWLRGADAESIGGLTTALPEQDDVRAFLLDSITQALSSQDRWVLEAASIFRDRFTDLTLAHVTELPRGLVQDAIHRLVEQHVATRGRDGDVAFFHASVRDYIYSRLDDATKGLLHARARQWFLTQGEPAAAAFHAARSPQPYE